MNKSLVLTLLAVVTLLVFPLGSAAESDSNTYILLNVTSDGPLITRRLVFAARRSDNEYVAQDLQNLGRGVTRYILDPVEPGKYYLSSIYPSLNDRETGNRVDVDDEKGVITLVKNAINYIGDIYIESDETSINVNEIVNFKYEPNSATLMAAVSANRQLFEELDVVITIAGGKPMKVDKKLLGLEN
ncbi:MAG: hypothetical protein AB8B95_00990 [Pseudohongiellaceae bacterium]